MRWSRLLPAALLTPLLVLAVSGVSGQSMPFVHKKRYAMGTVFEIVAYNDSLGRASSAVDQALDEVVQLDNLMSNFKPESDLSRMNREAHFHVVRIPPDLYKVIETSLVYTRLSDGEFDVSVGPVVDLWKAALDGGATPTAAEQARARACVGYEKIELIAPDQIEFRSDCMRLDLGAVGKGYAVDRAMEILHSNGIERAYIDAGGSTIYGMGAPPDHDGWLVHLRDPSNRLDPQVKLMGNSVSTSEQTAASMLEGDAPGHIVVPASGTPLRTRYAVSVTAKSATASDALSTTLLLLGPEKGVALVARLKDVSAIWVSADGRKTIAGSETTIFVQPDSGSQAAAATADSAAHPREKKN
jgi:thiamine biosynthesis lipoprotein